MEKATIKINEKTAKKLRQLILDFDLKTYDDVINKLIMINKYGKRKITK